MGPWLHAAVADLLDDVEVVPLELGGHAPEGRCVEMARWRAVRPRRDGGAARRPLHWPTVVGVGAVPDDAPRPRLHAVLPNGDGGDPRCARSSAYGGARRVGAPHPRHDDIAVDPLEVQLGDVDGALVDALLPGRGGATSSVGGSLARALGAQPRGAGDGGLGWDVGVV